jgi:hypothetical protein
MVRLCIRLQVSSILPRHIKKLDFNETTEIEVTFSIPHYVKIGTQVNWSLPSLIQQYKRTCFRAS